MSKFASPKLLLLALVVATLWTYSTVTQMGYVLWDDNVLVQDNALLRLPWRPAMTAMFGGFYSGDYMPLTLASYWLELRLLAFGPTQQHGINLALHLLNIVLLACWLRQIPWLRRWLPLICAVFALHPVQVESVAWISERKGLLASSLYFGAIWAALKLTTAKRHWWAYGLLYFGLFACAALAKANGLFIPFWLLALTLLPSAKPRPAQARTGALAVHLPVIAAALVFAWVRTTAYASSIPTLAATAIDASHLRQLPESITASIGFYVKTMLWPTALSIIYPPFVPAGPWFYETLLGAATLTFALTCCYIKSWRYQALCWLLAGLTIAPVMQLIPRLNFVNDRYLYLPLIGCTAGLALVIEHLARHYLPESLKRRVLAMGPLLLAYLFIIWGSSASRGRLTVWASNMALWSDTVAKTPSSSLAHNNLGQALLSEGDRIAARRAFESSISAESATPTGDNSALNNLANLHSDAAYPETFQLATAAALLQRAVALASRPEEAFIPRFNLALVYLQAGQAGQTLSLLQSLNQDLTASGNQQFLLLKARTQALITQLGGGG